MFSFTKLRFVPARLRYALASRSAAKPRSSRERVRLTLERLEDRLTPSTLTVTSGADDGSAGTLRAVLATANTDAANGISDTINFASSLAGSTIVLTQGQLELSGASTTAKITIDGSGLSTPVTISGNHASRVFQVDSGVQAELDDLTITEGYAGTDTEGNAGAGGGTVNYGSLTVNGCSFSSNSTTGNGGAIYTPGPLTVSNSTFTGNSAGNYGGGAISMVFSGTSDLAVSNCTFSGNTADSGGAILDWGAGSLTVAQCAFSDNNTPTGFAGAIYCLDPLTSITGSTFHANTASTGGAVYCDGQTSIDGSSFDQNSGAGGAILEDSGGHLTVTNSIFTDNPLAISTTDWAHNGTSLQVSSCTFTGNTDSAISNGGTGSISDSTFTNNYNGAISDFYESLTVTDCTITGTRYGYGIYFNGTTLTVDHCDISSNPGGGIWNNGGNASVSNSTISDNYGGVYSDGGSFTIVNSTLDNNSGTIGSAIYNLGTLSISDCTLTGNSATLDGGAIYNGVYYSLVGQLTLTGSTFSGNSAGRTGGAIGNAGTVTISNCSITGNSGWVGGGIENDGTATVSSSTIANNVGGNTGGGGGGVWNAGSFTISDSTLNGNTCPNGAAGIGSSGSLSITECTLTGNSTPSNGGAVYDVGSGSLTIQNSTIAGNAAGYGGGLCLNVNNTTPVAQMRVVNSIIANNTGTNPDIAGAFTSLGHNLIGNTTGGSGFVASDLLNVNPLLGPLQDNGGPTQTMALLTGSPAIDAGDNNNGGLPLPATDQRGFTRIINGTIDIGAFEVQKTATTLTESSSAATPLLGDSVTFTATVTATTGTPSGSVDFFDSTTGTDLGSVSLTNGVAALTTSALAVGNHTIVAMYSGDNSFLSSQGSTTLTVLAPSSLSGIVYEDFNDDGQVDFGELGISGVTVTLTGTDDLGHAVSQTQVTDGDGAYVYLHLRPGNYYLTETQPSGYLQGIDTVGTAGGSLSATDQFFVTLGQGINGLNYNYGEQPPAGGAVQSGQTATIGFWNNKNGQALINSFNGGSTSTQLGDWLAATLPNTFGVNAGSNDLAGKSNADIAALFQSDFLLKGVKLDAQVLATALSVYATNATLDNTGVAANYGFIVSGNGLGTATVNVGSNGAAFGVADNSVLTVMDLLKATDAQAVGGLLYNGDDTLRKEANNVYSAINEEGDIS